MLFPFSFPLYYKMNEKLVARKNSEVNEYGGDLHSTYDYKGSTLW